MYKDTLVRVFRNAKQWLGKKNGDWKKKDILSGSFGIMFMYQNYVKSGNMLIITMYTQGLKSFANFLVR